MPPSASDPADPPVRAATFAVTAAGSFTGSPELLVLLGFTPGEVVPTRAALAAHVAPDDRDRWQNCLDDVLATGVTGVVWHRLTTADNRERQTTTTLTATLEQGRVVAVTGVLADLTDSFRSATAAKVSDAVNRAVASRGPIEQAKGILMAVLDLDDAQAFDLLRWHSSHANIKLRELCALVVDRMAGTEGPLPPRQRLAAVLALLRTTPGSAGPSAALPANRGWTSSTAPTHGFADVLSTDQLPAALLPGILTRAVEDASVSITVADMLAPDQPLVYVNTAFERLTGYRSEQVLGQNCRFLQAGDRDEKQTAALRDALAEGRSVEALIRNYRVDGSLFYNEVYLSPVRNRKGRLTHYIGYQLDATERVERERQLERLAFYDAATGLLNRLGAIRAIDDLLSTGAPPRLEVIAIRFGGSGAAPDHALDRALGRAAVSRLCGLAPHHPPARVTPDCLVLFGAPDSVPSDDELRGALEGSDDIADSRGRVQLGRVRAPADGLTAQNLIDQACRRAGGS